MKKQQIIDEAKNFAKKRLGEDYTGHDYWHSIRVAKNALIIADDEGGDKHIIELAAILHDIADHKFNNDTKIIEDWLNENDPEAKDQVMHIINNISFKKGTKIESKEGLIVQDADRLDAIGAIGIARTFATGAYFRRPLYNPEIKPNGNNTTTINHFYDKLLLISDKLNTNTGKKLAKERNEFMKKFLNEFYKEWG
ncbi:MAG: HD domain-containing protein [Candidatus Woesearchaeota archaeon]